MTHSLKGFRRTLLCGGAIGVAIFTLGLPRANGQDPSGLPKSATSTIASKPEEVIVTTRKRRESVLKVPTSISVLSKAELKRYNIKDFVDYASQVPSLSFSNGGGAAYGLAGSRAIAIRGVAGNNTTGFYIDDTPVPATIDPRVVDLERIEVLKGPQGTLYGSGSEGGNVRLITTPPDPRYNSYQYTANVGGTSHGGSPDYGDEAIANLVLVPDQLALRLVQYDNHEAGYLVRTYPVAPGSTVTDSVGNQGQITTTGYSAALGYKINQDLTASLRFLFQNAFDYGWPFAYAPADDFKVSSYTQNRDENVQEKSKDIWYLPSFVLNYAGQGFTVTSSTSYFDRSTHDLEDGTEGVYEQIQEVFGYTGPEKATLWRLNELEQIFTQETRIAFEPIYHVSGVAGVYLSTDRFQLDQPPAIYPGLTPLYGDDNIYGGQSNLYTRTAALFGELYIALLPKLTLTLGARAYAIHQESDASSTGLFGSPAAGLSNSYLTGIVPKYALSYQATPDTLVYGLASKGFRPGGGGVPVPSSCDANLYKLGFNVDTPLKFNPDSDWNYEVGVKSALFGNRLTVTAAAFQIDWQNIQQEINLADCGAVFEGNGGAARIRGGEVELHSNPFEGLNLRAGVGYDNSRIMSQGAGVETVGSQINGVPTWTSSAGAEYVHPLTDTLTGFVSGDFSYTGKSNSINNSPGDPLVRAGYGVGNLRAGIRIRNTELALYINNFTNEKANLGDLQAISIVRQIVNAGGPTNDLRVTTLTPLEAGIQLKQSF